MRMEYMRILRENEHPYAVKSKAEIRVERKGNVVHVYMSAIRTQFTPDNIEGIRVGDTVYFHVTNLDQEYDIPHGFAIFGAENANILIMPCETRTLKWVPKAPGVHQEMQGYVRVSPANANVPLKWGTGKQL
jgi:nitrous-oxide reductase